MKGPRRIEKTALAITRWIGSPLSIVLHTILFVTIITLLVRKTFPFDVVILIFNSALSLEAIYLALFIQMTVNFQAESIEEVAEDVEEMQEDIGELQEDVEEITEEEESEHAAEVAELLRKLDQKNTLSTIQADLKKLMDDITKLQQRQP